MQVAAPANRRILPIVQQDAWHKRLPKPPIRHHISYFSVKTVGYKQRSEIESGKVGGAPDKCEPVSAPPAPAAYQATKRPRHSAMAAARDCLEWSRFRRWRSVGKGLGTETWTDAHFCNLRMRRNRNIACSRRRNGRSEFSARVVSQRPIRRSSPRPCPLVCLKSFVPTGALHRRHVRSGRGLGNRRWG